MTLNYEMPKNTSCPRAALGQLKKAFRNSNDMRVIIKKLIPSFFIDGYHFLLAFAGALLYGFPSRKIKVIVVTGTKGKSTTVNLISGVLEEAGFKTALTSSIKFKIAGKEWQNTLKMGMPGRFFLQKFLRNAVKAGCQCAIIEATSEGILQHRHKFIDFKAAVFTNLSPEHIEHHGSFENYRAAKGNLFKAVKGTHIINLDDEYAEYFLKFPAKMKYGYGLKISNFQQFGSELTAEGLPTSNFQTITSENVEVKEKYSSFVIHNSKFVIHLLGKFNIYNSLAAVAVGLSQGVSLETCQKALEKVKQMPGRMEEVVSEPFKVIVDYAHTADSLEKVYQALKTINYKLPTKLICVLGACGGGRDKWKRPKMGEVAGKYCDEVIITNEDPYDENPHQILSEIKSGITNYELLITNFYEILDRREAIKKALKLARPGDTVVITGKGCEPWMCVANGKMLPWDDRQIVREEYAKLKIYPVKLNESGAINP